MRARMLLWVSLLLLLRSISNCVALDAKEIQDLPRDRVEQALRTANPWDYYVYASRLLHEADEYGAAFWYDAGEIRFRFYLAANPQLSKDAAPALFESLHESVGSVVAKWAVANPEAAATQMQHALDWDAANDNAATSKSLHAKEWAAVRAKVGESPPAASAIVEQPMRQSAPGATRHGDGNARIDATLYLAMSGASRDEVARLIDQGASTNFVSPSDGRSAVSLAAMRDDPWFLKEVLEHGGDINIRNPMSGRTPLVEGLASGLNDNVRTLIAAGADMNTVDHLGMTPIIEAAAIQKYEIVYEMLVAGADPGFSPPQLKGKTILSVIRRSQVLPEAPAHQWQVKVVELLRQRGLDVDHGE